MPRFRGAKPVLGGRVPRRGTGSTIQRAVYRRVDDGVCGLNPPGTDKSPSTQRSGESPTGVWRVLSGAAMARPCPGAPTYQRHQPEQTVLYRTTISCEHVVSTTEQSTRAMEL
jgi:hypothetical protein